jgi:hypothetical protein
MGKYTIKQVLYDTLQSDFKNRLTNSGRDVLKRISIEEVTTINRGAFDKKFGTGVKKYRVKTYSYPQYKPYTNYKGKRSLRQRTIKHQYDIVLEMDKLTVNTTNWVMRVGSEKLPKKPNQTMIKQIYNETRELWYKSELKKAKNIEKDAKKRLKARIEKHKKRAKYVSVGDWQSKELGINQDFLYRSEWLYSKGGHLFGRNRTKSPPKITNPKNILFFDKHSIRFIQYLLNSGILTND